MSLRARTLAVLVTRSVPLTEVIAPPLRPLGQTTRPILLTCVLMIGCGSSSRPAPIDDSGGSAGEPASGGSAGSAGTPSGGSGNTGGSSGGSSSGGASGAAGGSGGVAPLEVFEPGRVYVQGKNVQGDCHTWIAALPEAPSDFEGSFPCDNDQLQIRSSDGALAYRVGPNDYRIWETDFVSSGFPPNPETNDIPLPAPEGCDVVDQWFQEGSAERVIQCEDGRFLSSSGELDLQGDSLLAVGKDGVLLSASDTAFTLRKSTATTPVELGSLSLNPAQVSHARAFGDGFLLLRLPSSDVPDPALRIAPDGSIAQLAAYPTATGTTVLQSCLLEPDGAAVCLGLHDATAAVLRFDPQGAGEVVYREADGLFLEGGRLFTGP